MGPIGHFSVGVICGIIIMLPFIRDKSLFDYETQKWISIEWMHYLRPDLSSGGQKLFSTDSNADTDLLTRELNPITKSKFLMWMPFVVIVCGIIALLPDISHFWGDAALDKSRLADMCFFHYSIDAYFGLHGFTTGESLMVEIPLMFTTIAFLLCTVAIAQDYQYNRKNFENCVV